MTCSACGNTLAQDVRFCPKCGNQTTVSPVSPYASVPVGMPYYRVSRNLQTLGTLWLVYAGVRVFSGLIGVLFLHGIFGGHFGQTDFNLGWSPFGRMWLDGLWPMALFSILVSAACTVLTGYALLTRQPWGRVLAIIFGILALIHLPLGTALGIYTLWVLGPRYSGDEYAALAYAQRGA